MKLTIVYPAHAHTAYEIAAHTFAALATEISGAYTQIVTDEAFCTDGQSDVTVLIGSDAANQVTAQLYLSKRIEDFGIRYGTDDYCIRTVRDEETRYLLLAGGRPRATLYAVYRYFEAFCGCRWFWDGDRVEKGALPLEGLDLTEAPRFAYRGLRYFAHRSLHRFQAEHWSLADWQKEIDWILKKRLNFFMLRIGMDDLFQKAFPETVTYPDRDRRSPEAGEGYDDRTLFWSLEYRGELRKKLLQYAFARDLWHPEDCGTVSHWYSRTPMDFLEKEQPDFLPQANSGYSEPTGRVWDVRQRRYMDAYLRLTDAHIQHYGQPQLFHTIGLGERLCFADRESNRRLKLYVYRKIATQIQEKYPNAPLLIASWDLWMHFTPQEVRELLAEWNPRQAILLDYTSDTTRQNNFTQWNVMGKFPWMFGVFGGYAPNSEIRGFYELTKERLQIAKGDPMCCGMILWPELSHGDPFTIESFAKNAWEGNTLSVSEQIDRYCRDRYPKTLTAQMTDLWHLALPIFSLLAWSMDDTYYQTGNDLFPNVFHRVRFVKEKAEEYRTKWEQIASHQAAACEVLLGLAQIPTEDAMTRRDVYDMARTVIGRFLNGALLRAQWQYVTDAPLSALTKTATAAQKLIGLLCELLASHSDYSLYDTLIGLQQVTDTNPDFEQTLKTNAECGYCRAYIYENAAYLYAKEIESLLNEAKQAAQAHRELRLDVLQKEKERIRACYFQTPLAQMQRKAEPLFAVLQNAAQTIADL